MGAYVLGPFRSTLSPSPMFSPSISDEDTISFFHFGCGRFSRAGCVSWLSTCELSYEFTFLLLLHHLAVWHTSPWMTKLQPKKNLSVNSCSPVEELLPFNPDRAPISAGKKMEYSFKLSVNDTSVELFSMFAWVFNVSAVLALLWTSNHQLLDRNILKSIREHMKSRILEAKSELIHMSPETWIRMLTSVNITVLSGILGHLIELLPVYGSRGTKESAVIHRARLAVAASFVALWVNYICKWA